MKFFLLDLLQKGYLNIIVFFNKFFNIGNGNKKKVNLTDLSVNMIFYFFVYVFFVFVFDVLFFNEEFFISLGLILFVLFVRALLTEALMPFFFQYKTNLEYSIYELSEAIFFLSSKLQKYYSLELYFLSILRKNLYGITVLKGSSSVCIDNDLITTTDQGFNLSGNTAATVNVITLSRFEQSCLVGHLEVYFRKIFSFFVNEVFLTYFKFQYQLRLSFYSNLVKSNLIVRVPLTLREQAESNFLIF